MRPDLVEHSPVLIPLLFLGGAMIVILLSMLRPRLSHPIAMGVSGLATILAAFGLERVVSGGTIHYHLGGWTPPIGIELVLDPLSALLVLMMCGVGFLVLMHARRSLPSELPGREPPFYALSLLLLAGLCGIVLTGDLFNLYVFIEIVSLSSYALLGVGSKRAPLSAFRYLVMGTTAGSLYLLGLALVYMQTGTLNMVDLGEILPSVITTAPVGVGLTFMLTGLALKSAIFPLHGWLPDAYTDAISTATALIAPIATKAALYAIIRILFFVVPPNYTTELTPIADLMCVSAGCAIVYGSVMAMGQKELKRMLAYSSVAQVGYIAMGIGLASPLGYLGAVLHILNHACMKGCLFCVSGNLRYTIGHSYLPKIDASVRRRMPWSMAAFSIAAVSMIGLPPTAGFFSKWYLAKGALEQGRWILLSTLLLSTLMNAVYFVRMFEQIYLRPTPEGESGRAATGEAPRSMLVPTLVFAALLLILGLANAVIVAKVLEPMLGGLS